MVQIQARIAGSKRIRSFAAALELHRFRTEMLVKSAAKGALNLYKCRVRWVRACEFVSEWTKIQKISTLCLCGRCIRVRMCDSQVTVGHERRNERPRRICWLCEIVRSHRHVCVVVLAASPLVCVWPQGE